MSLGTPKLNTLVTDGFAVHLIKAGLLTTAMPDVQCARLSHGTGDEPDRSVTLTDGEEASFKAKCAGPATWSRASAKHSASFWMMWVDLEPLSAGNLRAHVWVLRHPHLYLSAGTDWRSEHDFARRTEQNSVCVEVPMIVLAMQRAAERGRWGAPVVSVFPLSGTRSCRDVRPQSLRDVA